MQPLCNTLYGSEYKRPRPFTPATAARPKRQSSIHALPEVEPAPPELLDFDDVVDDVSEPEPEVVEDELEVVEVDIAEARRASGVDEAQNAHSGIGFSCPFEECKPAAVRWMSVDGLTKHLLHMPLGPTCPMAQGPHTCTMAAHAGWPHMRHATDAPWPQGPHTCSIAAHAPYGPTCPMAPCPTCYLGPQKKRKGPLYLFSL